MEAEAAAAAAAAAGSGGGGAVAPFLMKTYDMVDDTCTDGIVSWSSDRKSFVVWDPPEFARVLLPTYFKHSNFSSFIRQLNTYGFRKIDPEQWEFANEDFVKDQKHLLKNIHRKKPVHSHSNPPGTSGDLERASFEEEIEKLTREKDTLSNNLLMLKQQQSVSKLQLEDTTLHVSSIEYRQKNLLSYLEKALENRSFVGQLAQELEAMDFSTYSKRRRLPQAVNSLPVPENSFVENTRSSSVPEFQNIYHQDFSNKLTLELSPAVSDKNFLSHSTQISNEDNMGSPQSGPAEGNPLNLQIRGDNVFFAPETLELSDTGTSFAFQIDTTLSRKTGAGESPGLCSLLQNVTSNEEVDALIPCHLNLTLASSQLQVIPQQCNEVGNSTECRPNKNAKVSDLRDEDTDLCSLQEETVDKNQAAATASPVQGNDKFWEQFLTERPGCSETEELSSSDRGSMHDDQEDRKSGNLMSRNAKGMENLTL